ncbi:MAG: ion transporter [Cyclobacteriaceae bacterium]
MFKISKTAIMKTIDRARTKEDRLSRIFDIFIMTLIILNVAAVILETVDSIADEYHRFFVLFELFSVIIFTFEYFLRLWACTGLEEYSHPVWGRISYMFTLGALIDLLAILPFYIPIFISIDGRFLRILRLFRLFRLFKLGRYSSAFKMIENVLNNRRSELTISVGIILSMLVIASSMMYFIENEAQPEKFSSIPETMWWGVATLTTVGYGDVYPITPFGQLFGAVIAILGVGMFALPAGIIAAGFERELTKKEEKEKANQKADEK